MLCEIFVREALFNLIALRLGRCSLYKIRHATEFYSFRIPQILENCDYTIK